MTKQDTVPAARAEDVWKVYGSGEAQVVALRGVNLNLTKSEFTAIMGPSGSGKSTLMHCLAGLDTVTRGEVWIGDTPLGRLRDHGLTKLRRTDVGFIFQQFNLIPTLTAQQNVEAALAAANVSGREAVTKANSLLASVGLEDRGRHLPGKLSGGEQQRVAIARALANEPRVLLADEPTGNLDTETGREVISTLRSLAEVYNQTVVVVTHDPRIAAGAPRLMNMNDGRILESKSVDAHNAEVAGTSSRMA
jgi:putative ABC transport system ATP-binding protein